MRFHTYQGAQATEVAFLLRKLKHRISARTSLQCFATSASLPQSNDADREVAKFASELFGESFGSVIRGKRVMPQQLVAAEKTTFSRSILISGPRLARYLANSYQTTVWIPPLGGTL